MRTISRFHYATVFIDGAAFSSEEQLHRELDFKPRRGRNYDALLDCLPSIDDPHENLCAHWELHPGKRMVFQIRSFSEMSADKRLLMKFAQTIAAANERLSQGKGDVTIWVEFA